MIRKLIDPSTIEMPNWVDEQLLTVKPIFQDRGRNIPVINGIVIHLCGKSWDDGTAEPMIILRGMKDQSGSNTVSVSSNFVIGLDGEIIECVPVGERHYAPMRGMRTPFRLSAAIRAARRKVHRRDYDSLVKLTAWLCKQLEFKYERRDPSLLM